jgi:hypothetical protein
MFLLGVFLFAYQPDASAIPVVKKDCDCMGLKGIWVDGGCYLQANPEYCSQGGYWKTVKRCKHIEGGGSSMCDCDDEELCPPSVE